MSFFDSLVPSDSDSLWVGFRKAALVNLPWLLCVLIIFYVRQCGNFDLGFWELPRPYRKILVFITLVLVFYQPILWKKSQFSLRKNLTGYLATALLVFYYNLDANILFFIKTATVYYSSLFSLLATPFLFAIQILVWLYLGFRKLRHH